MFATAPLVVLSLALSANAAPHDAHVDVVARTLPRRWYHPVPNSVHHLFRRAGSSAAPGSPEWRAQYPSAALPPMPEAQTPASWLAALSAAEQAGKIPNIPVATATGGSPTYPNGANAGSPEICSSTQQCRGDGDIWDAPDGHVGIGFDDGPSDGSAKLYQFLQEQNQSATHFMIGVNILNNPQLFNEAFTTLDHDIAVHTWTHPYMTTMNNTQIVAQLGWTMQIIHDMTGGRIPRYWRPPYGDSDNRVRAIARAVFNITQIDWNKDSADWTIQTGGSTRVKVEASINGWYSGSKSPGLIVLEHELTNDTSTAFMNTYPAMKSNGWTPVSVVDLFDGAWQNSEDNVGPVQSMDVAGTMAPPSATSNPSASASSPNSTQGSGPLNNNNSGKQKTSGARRTMPPLLFTFAGMFAFILQ